MVHVKIESGAARLTSPAIATQNLIPQLFISLGIELETRLLRPHRGHAACSVMESKNAFRSSTGRNWTGDRKWRIRAFQILELYKNKTHIGFVLTKTLVIAHHSS